MTKKVDVSPTLRFILVKAPSGDIDPYLTSPFCIEFQQGDKIVAYVEVGLTPEEQEMVADAFAETDELLSSGSFLRSLAEKIFLAGYSAGAGLGRRE